MNLLQQYPVLVYALRVLLVSAALYSYYWIFLYNKAFHQVNRFFLLGTALLSLLLPLVPLSLHLPWMSLPSPAAVKTVILPASSALASTATTPHDHQDLVHTGIFIAFMLYCLVSAILLFRLVRSVHRIVRAARKYPVTRIGPIHLLNTNEPGAPFSFLHWLFWDRQIDPHQDQGRLIFLHESYHIRQYHTLDILGLECIRCLCWFNPFLHLICREIRTVHEFLADHNALRESDQGSSNASNRYAYAELLVWQAAIQTPPFLQHPFFHSSIKRRITMITQSKFRRTNPLGRIMALPILVLLLAGATAVPAQDTQPTSIFKSASSPDSAKLVRLYCKTLRYPRQVLDAMQEGMIRFSIHLDKTTGISDFSLIDAIPPGNTPIKIVVVAYPPEKPSQPITKEQARSLLLEEARRASVQINQQLAEKGNLIPPGEYYLEIQFSVERPQDKTHHA